MIGTLLDPNMCLSGPKRLFGGPKTDQILIFWPKRCAQVPYVTTEGQIGVNLSVPAAQQWSVPFLIPFCAFKGPFGSWKAHIGIQKGTNHCWATGTDRLTPIWPSVVTKGTCAHLFQPKNQYFISFWSSRGPFGSTKSTYWDRKGSQLLLGNYNW